MTPRPNDLYETDYVAWARAQAAALRARGAGGNALDYDNLAEEVEDWGKSEVNACASQIDDIIEHLLKIEFVGPRQTIPHWKGEIANFRRQLSCRLTRTIENQLLPELAESFRHAVGSLHTRQLIGDRDNIFASLGDGYAWDQIVDPDWYPEPRYES